MKYSKELSIIISTCAKCIVQDSHVFHTNISTDGIGLLTLISFPTICCPHNYCLVDRKTHPGEMTTTVNHELNLSRLSNAFISYFVHFI